MYQPERLRLCPVNTIGAGSGITQLSAGGFHVLALKSNGTVLAWGSNGSGQLGDGTTTDPSGPGDPEFRAAFVSYLEWGTRLAMHNSQPGADIVQQAPVPRWGWGVAPPYQP